MEHNPFLVPETRGARGSIEQRENIPWQHRAAPPSAFENGLGDALEQAFAKGAHELADVVRELNALGSCDRSGAPWSEASFEAEMKRLAGP